MDILLKEILPICLILYLFLTEFRRNKDVFLPICLFSGYILLSSNYSFPAYRIAFQGFQILLIFIYFFRYKESFFKDKNVNILCIFLIFILLSSFGNSLDRDLYISSVFNFLVVIFIIAYLNAVIDNYDKLYRLLVVVKKIAVIIASFAILSFIFEETRIELTTSNSNYLAFFLGVGLCLSLFLTKSNNIFPSLVICFAIILTGSRIVMIGSVLVIFLYIFSNKQKWIVNIISIIVIILLGLTIVNTDKFLNTKRFSEMDEDISTILRIEIIEASQHIIKKNPVNGLGYSQFQVKFLQYASKNSKFLSDQEIIVTHNDFIRVIDELGIPAAIFFLIILLKQCLIVLKLKGTIRILTLSLFIMVLIYSTAHNNLNTYMFWYFFLFPAWVYSLALKRINVKENR